MNGTEGLFSAIITLLRDGVVLDTATVDAVGRENAGMKEETKAILKMVQNLRRKSCYRCDKNVRRKEDLRRVGCTGRRLIRKKRSRTA